MQQIRLCVLVNNNATAVASARAAYDRLSGLLAPRLSLRLGECPIRSAISGFSITEFPLYKLGCLVGEEWLEEDVVNAVCELLYFKTHPLITGSSDPSHIILPTLLANEAVNLLESSMDTFDIKSLPFTSTMTALRRRLKAHPFGNIHLITCDNRHYSLQSYCPATGRLEHRDSLARPPPRYTLPIFRALLSDLSNLPLPTQVTIIPVPTQLQAVGSCGVAALKFLEAQICPQTYPWADSNSEYHRNAILRDLALFHLVSLDLKPEDVSTTPICDIAEANIDPNLPVGYNDFNILHPTAHHSARRFLNELQKEPFQPVTLYPDDYGTQDSPLTPLSDEGSEVELENALSRFLTPIKPEPMSTALPSDPSNNHSSSCPSTQSSPSHSHSFIDLTLSPRAIEEQLQSLIPEVKLEPTEAYIKQESEHPRTLPTTSAPPPTVKHSPSVKQERLPSVIVISDSDSDMPNSTVGIVDLTFPTPPTSPTASTPPPAVKQSPSVKQERLPSVIVISDSEGSDIPSSHTTAIPARIQVGTVFRSIEEAQKAIYASQEALGFSWRVAQSKRSSNGMRKKITYRCRCYYHHDPVHSPYIDPSDHRNGRSVKTGCNARVNINRLAGPGGLWNVTLVDLNHNHDRELASGARAPREPTSEQKAAVNRFATLPATTFSRSQLSGILSTQFPDHPLEPRQISNLINNARREAREEVRRLGGDVATILAKLQELKSEDPAWNYDIQLDSNQRLTSLFWQTPTQVELCRRFNDLVLTDDTYSRNQYNYPLNLGIGIDNFGHSRSLWFCLHESEDTETYNWIFQNYLRTAGSPPEILFSDRHGSLIRSRKIVMPLTRHLYCLHHLNGNIATNLRPALGAQWDSFTKDFWAVYNTTSPEAFDDGWSALISRFPAAKKYLAELYDCRESWAWPWVGTLFTAGIRTNGRVEVENRVVKGITNPKMTLYQVFLALNERASKQSVQEQADVRQSSRRQHDHQIESVFRGPLKLIREYAGPFALHTIFQQMKLSPFYNVEVVQLPPGMKNWGDAAVLLANQSRSFSWERNEESKMINTFTNDNISLSISYLLRQLYDRGLQPEHLFEVTHIGTRARHYLVTLPDNRYLCDCCMGVNLGIPCRHYFKVWTVSHGLKFHVGLIRARWYKNPKTNLGDIPTAVFDHASTRMEESLIPAGSKIALQLVSNPIDCLASPTSTPPPRTQTVGAREVNHEANAILRPMLAGVRTQEELDDVVKDLRALKRARLDSAKDGAIQDPPVLNPKGRPRNARITGAIEGRPRGGGPVTRQRLRVQAQPTPDPPPGVPCTQPEDSTMPGQPGRRRCGICRQEGHNRARCPVALAHT